MDTKELALTPSMTLDFLPIRPIPSPSDDDMTRHQDVSADRRAKSQKGREWGMNGNAAEIDSAGILTWPIREISPWRFCRCEGDRTLKEKTHLYHVMSS